MTYGAEKVFYPGDPTRVIAPGIVLIDEVDVHLHPTWQRAIGIWFTQHFPYIQFIVTSHSPLVCQAAEVGTVFLLPKPATSGGRMLQGTELDRLRYGNVLDAYGTGVFGHRGPAPRKLGTHHHRSWELTPDQTSRLRERCRREGVSVQSAICAASLPGFHGVHTPVNLRSLLARPVGESVGLFVGSADVTMKYRPLRGFWSNARTFHLRLRRAMRGPFGVYRLFSKVVPIELIRQLGPLLLRIVGQEERPFAVTNLGHLDGSGVELHGRSLKIESFFGVVSGIIDSGVLSVYTIGGSMRLHLLANESGPGRGGSRGAAAAGGARRVNGPRRGAPSAALTQGLRRALARVLPSPPRSAAASDPGASLRGGTLDAEGGPMKSHRIESTAVTAGSAHDARAKRASHFAGVSGQVAPGFEEVRTEFERNFAERAEIGAAVAAYFRGEKVVDLWGGRRSPDGDAPWNEDTMVVVMSSTKGLAAMTLALANTRGWLDYDAPVARYWPEFAQNGKEAVTVRQLLGHEAGLVLLGEKLRIADMRDLDSVARVLARNKPAWPPGTRHGYHTMSLGLYMQELIRHVDPARRTLGRFFHDEIAVPLGLEFYIGLPTEIPDERLATVKTLSTARALLALPKTPPAMLKKYFQPRSLLRSSFLFSDLSWNDRSNLEVELPAGNGVGTARAMARAYSAFAEGGAELGIQPETFGRITALPAADHPVDEVLGVPSYFSLGFMRPGPTISFGSSQRVFGAPGAGGSFAFADPDARLGYAYVMNKLDFYLSDDPREKSLRDAVYRAIARRGGASDS